MCGVSPRLKAAVLKGQQPFRCRGTCCYNLVESVVYCSRVLVCSLMLTRHKTNTIYVIISMVKEKGGGRFMVKINYICLWHFRLLVPAAYIQAALLMHKMPDRQKVTQIHDISRCSSAISFRLWGYFMSATPLKKSGEWEKAVEYLIPRVGSVSWVDKHCYDLGSGQ